MTLYGDFLSSDHRPSHKLLHYFVAYERHLERFRNRHVTLLEIGIGQGGSLQQWRRYLGPFAVIVGIDVNEACGQVEEDQVHVRIGSQSDAAFLGRVVAEFGAPDIVIDDGSHAMADINASFDALYPVVARNGVYLVEDLHAAYWPELGGGLREPGTFIERAKGFVDQINAEHSWARYYGDGLPRTALGDRTSSIHFYDSMVVLEVGAHVPRRHATTGDPARFDPGWTAPPAAPPAPVAPVDLVQNETASQGMLERLVYLQQRVQQLESAASPSLQAEILALRNSTSWRVTAPLRALARLWK